MGAFEYSALDAVGRIKKGVLEGDTPRQIRQLLREKGLTPVVVEEVVGRESRTSARLLVRRRINSTDLALFTRQLATLVRSGTVLEEALGVVAQQTDKPRLQSILMAVRSRVMEGHALATALADFPGIFSELYRATIIAGEQSGRLDSVLERLADYTEFSRQVRQRILLALLYPVLLTLVAVLIVAALLTYVVPQIVTVFENIGQELPPLTQGLIAVSSFLRAYGVILLAAIAAAAGIFRLLLRNNAVRTRFHRFLLTLPLVSRFIRSLNTARFTRSFSILTASGVPIVEGLWIASKVLTNLAMRRAIEEAADLVREGGGLHQSLARSNYFPAMTIHLIASGEAGSSLEEMLERAAMDQERSYETMVTALMGLFEPFMILVMGGIVLTIVLAVLLPIFDLNQLVK